MTKAAETNWLPARAPLRRDFRPGLKRESHSAQMEKRAREYVDKIEALGGMPKAIERGFVQQEIQNAAYEYQQQVDRGETTVVGVNRFPVEEEKPASEQGSCLHPELFQKKAVATRKK